MKNSRPHKRVSQNRKTVASGARCVACGMPTARDGGFFRGATGGGGGGGGGNARAITEPSSAIVTSIRIVRIVLRVFRRRRYRIRSFAYRATRRTLRRYLDVKIVDQFGKGTLVANA